MKRLENVTLLVEGEFPSQSGEMVQVTVEDMKDLAESYDPDMFEAFIVPGHSSDPMFGTPDTDTAISLGRIKEPRFDPEQNQLKGDLEIHDRLADWLEQGLFKDRSLAYYTADDPRNPTPGKAHIRHLAVLGAQPPAIKGLDNLLSFSEDEVKNLKTINIKQPIEDDEKEEMQKKLAELPPKLKEKPDRLAALAEKGNLLKKDTTKKEPAAIDVKSGTQIGEDEGDTTKKTPEGLAETAANDSQLPNEEQKEEREEEQEPMEALQETDEEEMEALQESSEEEDIEALQEGEDESDFDSIPSPDGVPEEELDGFMKENIPVLLAEVLSSGDRGYKGEITRFDPEPSSENNFLFNSESEKFEGTFIDASEDIEEVYEFSVRREGDEWTFEYKIVSDEEEEPIEESTEEEIPAETPADEVVEDLDPDNENVALSETATLADPATTFERAQSFNEGTLTGAPTQIDQMMAEIAMLRSQVSELKDIAIDNMMSMAFGENRLLPANFRESDFRAFAESVYDLSKQGQKPALVGFSEGSDTPQDTPLFDVLSSLVSSLPVQVEAGVALSESADVEFEPIVAPPSPKGFRPDEDGQVVFNEAVRFAEANGLDINDAKQFNQAILSVYK